MPKLPSIELRPFVVEVAIGITVEMELLPICIPGLDVDVHVGVLGILVNSGDRAAVGECPL